jgi:hypothetical protein
MYMHRQVGDWEASCLRILKMIAFQGSGVLRSEVVQILY